MIFFFFFFSSRRRHTRLQGDWSSDVCSSDLGRYDLRQAPPGERLPPLVVDSHEIAYGLARQFARAGGSLSRRLYAGANWRKLRREELGTYRDADGVYLCSAADERRL